jgi:hypothetical protein
MEKNGERSLKLAALFQDEAQCSDLARFRDGTRLGWRRNLCYFRMNAAIIPGILLNIEVNA